MEETNLQKAKRLIKDNAYIIGIDLPEDSLIFKMLELASKPDRPDQQTIRLVFDWIQSENCIIKSTKTGKQYLDAVLEINGKKLTDYVNKNYIKES